MRTRRGDANGAAAGTDETEKGCICGATHPETSDLAEPPPSNANKRGRGVSSLAAETFWIQCDGTCRAWYHVSSTCVGFPSATAASTKKLPSWTCPECVEQDKQKGPPPICRSEEEVDLYTPCHPLIVALNYPLWYASIDKRADDGDNANGDGTCVCGSSHDPTKQENPLFWLQCDGCQSWFNNSGKCLGMTEDEAQMLDRWICTSCCSGSTPASASTTSCEGKRTTKKAKLVEFHPGHICNDAVFYCTLDDETCADVATKLGCNWRNVAIANKVRYGKIKPDSKFEERTLLLLPKKIDPETIVALQTAKAKDPLEVAEEPVPHDEEQPAPTQEEAEEPAPRDDEQPTPTEAEEPAPHDDEQPAPTFITAEDLNVKPGKADSTGQYYCTLDDESCAIVAQKLGCEWQDLAGINRDRYGRITARSRFEERTILAIPSNHEAVHVARLGKAETAKPLVSPSPTELRVVAPKTDESKVNDASFELSDTPSVKSKEEAAASDTANEAAAADKQNETFYPGYVCKDMIYYSALDNETVRQCAGKLGCQCKDLIDLNKGTYKGLKATSELQEGTILEIPLAKTAAAIKKLEALYHYEDKLDFCYDCFLLEKRGEPMLLCDGCDAACHLPCAFPGLTEVPEGDWFCKKCTARREEAEREELKPKAK